jgi:hypothetical protein
MRKSDYWLLIASCGIFAVFFANVVTGATGGKVFLSDLGEMLTLFTACISFVVAVLHQERLKSGMPSQTDAANKREKDQK